jgi:DNA invertase Pin-like site-specific DNA recombinase
MTTTQGTRSDDDFDRLAGFYGRVSRSGKRNLAALERHTLNTQRAGAERVLPRGVGLVLDDRYRDVNVSGRTRAAERPGLSALFADIEAGKINDVVVGYLSRFGRNTAELMLNVQRLDELGATLYVGGDSPMIVTPGIRGTSKLLLTVLAAVDEMQADALEDGLKAANETAIADGISIQVPYGYRRSDGPGSPLTPDDDQSHGPAPSSVVQRIYAMRAMRMGCSEIAERLNDERILTPSALAYERGTRDKPGAARWRHNTIANLIAVATYRGVIPRAIKWAGVGKQRKPIAWEYLPGQHVELVSDDEWKDAQLVRERAVRNGSTEGALLRGLARCSSCSRTMRPNSNQGKLSYVCSNKECTQHARITRAPADAYVVAQLLDEHTELAESQRDSRDELDKARELATTRDEEYARFVSRAGSLPDAAFAVGNAEHLQRLADAQNALAALEARSTPDVGEALRNFDAVELDGQRALLASLLDAVVILPAPGRGRSGVVSERVKLIPKGTAPFELSGTGRVVESRPWPL